MTKETIDKKVQKSPYWHIFSTNHPVQSVALANSIGKFFATGIRDEFKRSPIGATLIPTAVAIGLGAAAYRTHATHQEIAAQQATEQARYEQRVEAQKIYDATYNRLFEKADTNHDNALTSDEWAAVYQQIGKRYDVHNWQRPTLEEMQLYLEK